jgi:hypothetical protein
MPGFEFFEFYGAAFARWLQEQNEDRPNRYEKVEPGDEQILPPREQRELDAVPSYLALRDEED